MNDNSNRRENPRRKTIFGGVLFNDEGKNWECFVSDISSTGVKVRAAELPESGIEINLKINKFNDLRRGKVTWVRNGEFGMNFLVPISDRDEELYRLIKPKDHVKR